MRIKMPSLSLRGLSDQAYEGLRQLATSTHRSMQEQVRLLIEREVRYAQVGGVEWPGDGVRCLLGAISLI